MPHDVLARHALAGGLDELPPPRFSLYLQLRGDPGEDEWAVHSFVLEERLHAPYALTVTVMGSLPEAGVERLLGARVAFELARGVDARAVQGVVLEAELVRGVEGLGDEPTVELHVVPAFALLGLSRRNRVFQGQSVVEIALAVMSPVLAKHGGLTSVERLRRTYPPRDYCVQFRETDLDFVLRILADEGITVMFDHYSGVETLVLVDDNEALPNAGQEPLEENDQPPPRMPLVGEFVDALPLAGIAAVGRQSRLRRLQWSAAAWDWPARPGEPVCSDTRTDGPAAVGGWWEAEEGRLDEAAAAEGMATARTGRRVQLQRLRDHATATRLRARSNATILRAGSVFELLENPHDELGDKWVVTTVRHEAHAEGLHGPEDEAVDGPEDEAVDGVEGLRVLAEGAAEGSMQTFVYGNDLECQPLRAPVVPPRSPRPRVVGMQSAVVTGPPGEAIHTDRFGRVRVRMLWDEQEHEGEPTSCWLRVATPWAGDGFGAVFVPRVGTEVLVSFVDGDPDRPICCACIYNGATMPPYGLPEHATRTVLRTRSVGGEGFNELSFEDAAGAEEMYLHAQGNLREEVLAHHVTEVGANQTAAVDGSRYARIGKDDVAVTAGEHRHTVSGQVTERYRRGYALHVGEVPQDPEGPADAQGMEINVVRGGYSLRSAEPIVLRCGESRLELRPDGIVLHAPRISAECPDASLVLERSAATLRANKKVELGADVLAAVGTSITAIKGSTCEIEGSCVEVKGERVTVEAASHIDIVTVGEVGINGGKINLN